MFDLTPRFGRRSVSVFDPFRELDNFERHFFGRQRPTFRTDIRETKDGYLLEAELPGFSREDISAQIKDGYLTVTAERKADSEDNSDGYIRRERSYGSFSRSFDLSGIDADAISAEYKDGILSITLPKQSVTVDEGKRLEIK